MCCVYAWAWCIHASHALLHFAYFSLVARVPSVRLAAVSVATANAGATVWEVACTALVFAPTAVSCLCTIVFYGQVL